MKRENLLGRDGEEKVTALEAVFTITLIVIEILLCLMLAVRYFWLKPYSIVGNSMYQTIDSGDWVLADAFATPKRGDVVILYNGYNGNKPIIKRVIALQGDTIRYDDNGHVYSVTSADGVEMPVFDENVYQYSQIKGSYLRTRKLEDGEVFVLGDNRRVSRDSRDYGAFKLSDVIGVVPDWVIENRKNLAWIYPYI